MHSLGLTLFHVCIVKFGGSIVEVMKWYPSHVSKKVKKYAWPSHFSDVLRATIESLVNENYRLRPTAEQLASIQWLPAAGVDAQRKRVRMLFEKVSCEEEPGLHEKYKEALAKGEKVKRETKSTFNTKGVVEYTATVRVT